MQVPYYLGDLTEKLEAEDRVQLVKAAEGQLLVLILPRNGIKHDIRLCVCCWVFV